MNSPDHGLAAALVKIMNKVTETPCLRAVLVTALLVAGVGGVAAQTPDHPAPAAPGTQAPAAPGADHQTPGTEPEHAEEHPGAPQGLLWPVANFIILAGGLWWFLREPFSTYLRDRHSAIRRDLVDAANMKAAAAAQLAEIDRRLQALPGEIVALRTRGGEEIAAEEERIAAQAAAERERLLEQTRREIEVQLRLAKRELVEHAADLAVQLAGERIQQKITPADQERLVDRYLDQVKSTGSSGSADSARPRGDQRVP
jgi:F-type H+-transporting ATPase subunit b